MARPRWEHQQVGTIERSEIQEWISELVAGIPETDKERAITRPWKRAPKSATTVLRAHGVLLGILRMAVIDKRIPSNPTEGANLPRKTRGKPSYLTAEQVELLADEAGDFGGLVLFLAYTGLRWGVATGMLVEDINFIPQRATVVHNAVMVGSVIETGTPKLHRQRWVPWPAFLRPYLTECVAGKGRESILWGDGVNHLRLPNSVDGWFAGAVRRARARDKTMPRITPHDLRHTTASLAVAAGANVKAVQRMLGHASAAMTLDVYADRFDDDLDSVATALEARRGQIVGKRA